MYRMTFTMNGTTEYRTYTTTREMYFTAEMFKRYGATNFHYEKI